MTSFTIVDDGRSLSIDARVDGERVHVRPDVAGGLGVENTDTEISLADLAHRLGRPLALDAEERAVWLGVSAAVRARALSSLEAPDFSLPDVEGRLHRLADHRGRKILLVAWASW